MELKGNLKEFKIEELIKFISSSKRTGVLKVSGKTFEGEKIDGEIYFQDGDLINAKTEGKEGKDALFYLFGVRGGEFSFSKGGTESIEKRINESVEEILFQAAKNIKVIENLLEKLPSFDTILIMNPKPPSTKITLNKNEWFVLNKFRDGRKIKEVLEELKDIPKFEVLKIIFSLLSSNLLTSKGMDPMSIIPKYSKRTEEFLKSFVGLGPSDFPTSNAKANRVFFRIDGKRSLSEISKELNMDRKEILKIFLILLKKGVIKVDIDSNMLSEIEKEVKQ